MTFTILIPPLIGGVIGYITNALAIKMLFRPRRAVFVFGKRLPFTPGLIPKEQARVARSVGNVISTQLLNAETLTEVLTSENMTEKIRSGIESLIEKNKSSSASVGSAVLWFAPREDAERAAVGIRGEAARMIYERITSDTAKAAVTEAVSSRIRGRLSSVGFGIFDKIAEPVARGVSDSINGAIADNGMEFIEKLLDGEMDKLKNTKICDLIDRFSDKTDAVTDFVMNIYLRVVREHLGKILADINIAEIVENRVASFDVSQLESMIFGLMKKELNAIVYLGALLGFLMGWINLLFRF